MIDSTLYKKEWKSNWVVLLIFMGVLTMYAVMIVSMFDPKLGDSLRVMAASMPEVFSAFGMADVGQTLLEFVVGYLYGILLLAFPAVYIILLSNRLVAKYVDNGSMAYLLAVPKKRSRIVVTQVVFLASSLLTLILYVAGVILLAAQFMFPGELDIPAFIRVNIGLFGLWIMMGGVCFFCSCLFNESKKTLGVSTAFVVYCILVQMISQVGDKFEVLRYATPLTLFQTDGLASADGNAWIYCGIMYIVGIGFLMAGIMVFRRKDLPL